MRSSFQRGLNVSDGYGATPQRVAAVLRDCISVLGRTIMPRVAPFLAASESRLVVLSERLERCATATATAEEERDVSYAHKAYFLLGGSMNML